MGWAKTVLVVDDADMVRTMVSFMLEKAGYNTLAGVDGEEALTFLDGREVDLVITDLNMPNVDGAELITKIRSNELYQYTPVVLFMADDADDKGNPGRTSGATMTFDKNNIKEKLLPAIKKLIG